MSPQIPKKFPLRVAWRRRHLGLTQHQLATKMRPSYREADIKRWENPKGNFPREEVKIQALAKALETSTDFLFGLTDDPRPTDLQADAAGVRLPLDESYPESNERRRRPGRGTRRASGENGSTRRPK